MNIIDLNLDLAEKLKSLPKDCSVFYFLTGPKEGEDLLFAKGSLEDMCDALVNLMGQHEDIEWLIKNAVIEFQS